MYYNNDSYIIFIPDTETKSNNLKIKFHLVFSSLFKNIVCLCWSGTVNT